MDIKTLIKSRRTIRHFEQKPLTKEQLTSYIDAARLAPAAANVQPLKYVVVQSADMAKKVFPNVKWAGYLKGEYNPNPGEEPVAYIAVCEDKSIKQAGNDMDIGAAVENIILAALSDGVGACWMAAIDREEISKLLKLSENLYLSCVVALGYPKESPKEVAVTDDDIKYYVDGETLCVPKRAMDEVLIDII